MIIDYDFHGKRVALVGGGRETVRKIRAFTEAGAKVRLVGPSFDEEAVRVAKELRVLIVSCRASEIARRAFAGADAVVVVDDDRELGRRLRPIANRRRVLLYVGDDPAASDWVQPAVRFAGPIEVAVSTGGASPIVARSLVDRLVRKIGETDRLEVRVQAFARDLARRCIASPEARRQALYAVHEHPEVRAALVHGDLIRAKDRARRIVHETAARLPPRSAARTAWSPRKMGVK